MEEVNIEHQHFCQSIYVLIRGTLVSIALLHHDIERPPFLAVTVRILEQNVGVFKVWTYHSPPVFLTDVVVPSSKVTLFAVPETPVDVL